MKKRIYIVGGDGFARECFHNIQIMRIFDKTVEFAGFLGHGGYGHTVDYKNYQQFYLGEVSEHNFADDEYACIGAGYPDLRKKIYEELKARGIRLANIYTEPLCESAVIGEGKVIINSNGLGPNVVLGNGNVLNGYVITGHDVKMGDFNFLGPRCMLLGYVSIGNSNTIGAGSIILAHKSIGNNNTIAPLSVVYRSCQDSMHLLGNPAKRVEF